MANFYAILTRFPQGQSQHDLADRSRKVKEQLIEKVPALTGKWVTKFAFDGSELGAIDVAATSDRAEVEKAARIISEYGDCQTEVVAAYNWHHFLETRA